MLAPERVNKQVDINSLFMDTVGEGITTDWLKQRKYILSGSSGRKTILVSRCVEHLKPSLSHVSDNQNITEDQINVLLEIMTLVLIECKSCEDGMLLYCRDKCIESLVRLIAILTSSNKSSECKAWMKEHMLDLTSLRMDGEGSILHLALKLDARYFAKEPIVRMLVEVGKMDVNVVNSMKETPLHLLSTVLRRQLVRGQQPTEEMLKLAELLIDNGAHMDAMDTVGYEASHGVSRAFPQYSFNVNLKCLAAKALLENGVKYKSIAPKTVVPFIESHKLRGITPWCLITDRDKL